MSRWASHVRPPAFSTRTTLFHKWQYISLQADQWKTAQIKYPNVRIIWFTYATQKVSRWVKPKQNLAQGHQHPLRALFFLCNTKTLIRQSSSVLFPCSNWILTFLLFWETMVIQLLTTLVTIKLEWPPLGSSCFCFSKPCWSYGSNTSSSGWWRTNKKKKRRRILGQDKSNFLQNTDDQNGNLPVSLHIEIMS